MLTMISYFILFQLEASGEEMVCLCSKTYILKDVDQYKFSHKGMNKNSFKHPMPAFKSVLRDEKACSGENKGFKLKNGIMYTYEESRSGLSYFYCKRTVLEDGVTTEPLDIVLSPWNIPDYLGFSSQKDELSNYYPCRLHMYDHHFNNVVEAYDYQLRIRNNAQGTNHYINESKLGEQWHVDRKEIMKEILIEKMRVNQSVRKVLRDSDSIHLLYCSRNKYWGIGMLKKLASVSNEYRGKNVLGEIWEEIRENKWEEVNKVLGSRCSECGIKRADVKYRREREEDLCSKCK